MDLIDAYKIITTPSLSRPAEVERLNKFLMSLTQPGGEAIYEDFFKQIPSNWTTLSVDKQFAFNNPGIYHIGDKDSQFLLINTDMDTDVYTNPVWGGVLLGLVFGKKVVSSEMREMQELLDTAMLVDELNLVLEFPDYKILNWLVSDIESLLAVE